MDLDAAKLAHWKMTRLTRASMVACFVVAGVMLIASLALANGSSPSFVQPNFAASITTLH
jgi:hypothetical protein